MRHDVAIDGVAKYWGEQCHTNEIEQLKKEVLMPACEGHENKCYYK